jgi:hypothetical protein
MKNVTFNCNINSSYFYIKDKSEYINYILDNARFKKRIDDFETLFKLCIFKRRINDFEKLFKICFLKNRK